MPHISGVENAFLIARAVVVGIDQSGRAYVVNVSGSHEVVVRPWGAGPSGDVALPPAVSGSPLQPSYVEPGSYWIRNGRHWDARRACFGPSMGDDRTSWVLLQVEQQDPLGRGFRAPTADRPAVDGSTVMVLGDAESWTLSEAQIRSASLYFGEFLSWPPRVAPRILTEPAAERAGLEGGSRLDHLVQSARRRGFNGDRNDLLAWLVSNKYLTLAQVAFVAREPVLATMLFPTGEYRPPG